MVVNEIFNKGKRIFFGNNTDTPVNMTKEDRYVNVSKVLLEKYKWDSWKNATTFVKAKIPDPPTPNANIADKNYIETRWQIDGTSTRAGDEILESILNLGCKDKTIEIHDQGQGTENDANCGYIIMATLLLQDPSKNNIFRLFFHTLIVVCLIFLKIIGS
jgi:hypothetical protein